MPALLVFNYTVTNPEGYEPYRAKALETLQAHGAEILAADFESEHVEGDGGHVTVVLRFADKDAARAWYESPEYQAVVGERLNNSDPNVGALINGIG